MFGLSRPVLVLVCLIFGCGKGGQELDRLIEASTPRAEAFAQFEVWAHRAKDAMPSPTGELEGLAEATFAPIRHDEDVLFALVEHRGPRVRTLAFPTDAALPAGVSWQPVRTQAAGELQAALLGSCAAGLPAWWRDGAAAGACLLLRRETPRGVGGDSLRVTLGFRLSGSAVVSGP